MNNSVRLRSKYLLSQNTFRLFCASAISFILRWGFFSLAIFGLYFFLSGDLIKNALTQYNNVIVFTSVGIVFSLLFFIYLLSAAAIKAGEEFLFFTRAQGAKGYLKLLFRFFHPKKAFRFLSYYIAVNILKLSWFIYFFTPAGICLGSLFYVYNNAYFSKNIYMIISFCTTLFFALSFVVWRICIFRYGAAPYYLCLNPDTTVSEAIKKSIRFTDSFLTDGVLLEYSHLGWILSCIFVVPLIYVVPYIKLTQSVFIIENTFAQVPSYPRAYSVNLLNLISSGQHINQRHYE